MTSRPSTFGVPGLRAAWLPFAVAAVVVVLIGWSWLASTPGPIDVVVDALLGSSAMALAFLITKQAQHQVALSKESLEAAAEDSGERAELLEVILESLAEGVTAIDDRGTVLVHNRAATEMLGTAPSSQTNQWQTHYGVFYPDGKTIFPEREMPMVRALAGESSDDTQMLIRNPARPDGLPIEVSARPYRTPSGQQGSVAVFRDVSERHAAESAGDQQSRLLSGVVETARDAFILIDGDGYVHWWNKAAERIFGWSRDEAVGGLLADLIVPDGLRGRHTEGLRRRVAGEPARLGPEPVKLTAVRRDGTEIEVELALSELDWGGRLRFHAVVRDISEREVSSRALEQSEARFRLAFEHAPIGKILTNLSQPDFGRIIAVNPAVEKMLGYSKADVSRMSFRDITHPDDAQKDAKWVPKLLSGEVDKIEYEKRYLHKDGHHVWVALSASVVRAPDGSPVHSVTQIVDITERRATAEQLIRLNRELEQSNAELATANAELDQFAATVAHDLKNPLTAIAGMVEIFDDSPGRRTADEEVALASIARTTDRMRRMIDDLLSYSRASREEMAVEVVDLGALIEEVAAEVAHSADGPIHVTHDELPHIEVQPRLFRQVMGNLIGNAVKYVAPGTEARVHIVGHEDRNPPGWTIRIRDNGIGIPATARDRVFAMFHRETTGSFPGTGIGLATCRKIVERHGGKIWIEGGAGGGTVIALTIPRPGHVPISADHG